MMMVCSGECIDLKEEVIFAPLPLFSNSNITSVRL
jgi:hypothetical protein